MNCNTEWCKASLAGADEMPSNGCADNTRLRLVAPTYLKTVSDTHILRYILNWQNLDHLFECWTFHFTSLYFNEFVCFFIIVYYLQIRDLQIMQADFWFCSFGFVHSISFDKEIVRFGKLTNFDQTVFVFRNCYANIKYASYLENNLI